MRSWPSRTAAASSLPPSTETVTPLWLAASVSNVQGQDSGRGLIVGTFHDVTTAHYAAQRESALAAMGLFLSQAGSLPEAVRAGRHFLDTGGFPVAAGLGVAVLAFALARARSLAASALSASSA